MDAPGGEEGVGVDEKRVGPLARKRCEGRVDLAAGVGVEHLDLQPHGARTRCRIPHRGLGRRIMRADEHGNASGCRHHLTQEFQPLGHQLRRENIDTCQVAARPGKASDKTKPDRVIADVEDDGDRRGCPLGRDRRTISNCCYHGDLAANEVSRQLRQPIKMSLRPAVLDRYVLAFNIAGVFELGEIRAYGPRLCQTMRR